MNLNIHPHIDFDNLYIGRLMNYMSPYILLCSHLYNHLYILQYMYQYKCQYK